MLKALNSKYNKILYTIILVAILSLAFNTHICASSKGEIGEFADEYDVEYTVGGTLTSGDTVATLKFNTNKDIEISGILKINTLATLVFDSNPYRIVYEKGLSDDTWRPNSNKPSPGYPKDTELIFNNESGLRFRSYYEDGKERLGRSYIIRFDSNDVNDKNGSTQATLVKVTKTEVPSIESLDFKNTGRYKQSIITDTNKLTTLSFRNSNNKVVTITTEDNGFNGTLFFKHWSIYNKMTNKNQYFKSLENIPVNANFTGEFGGKVTATAIWETRNFEYGKDFSDVTRPGYTFKGWLSTTQGKLINSSNKILSVNPCNGNESIDYSNTIDYGKYMDVLVAQWKAKKYRIILDGNQPEGNHTIDMRLVEFDSKIGTLPTPKISVANSQYKFVGWYNAKVGGKLVDLNETYTYTHGMVLYAHWEIDTHQTGEIPDIDPSLGTYDYLVPESQIVRAVELSKNDFDIDILGNKYWFWHYELTCPGHTYNGDTIYCSVINSEELSIHNINFGNSSYKKFIASVNPWSDFSYILEQEKSSDDVIDDSKYEIIYGTIENNDSDILANQGDIRTRHNYTIAFHRGNDELTIADWKNNTSNKDKLEMLSKFNISNVSLQSRANNGSYKNTTSMQFRGDSSTALYTDSIKTENVCSNGGGTVELKSGDFNKDITVAYKVYKGNSSNTPNKTSNVSNNENINNTKAYDILTIGTDDVYAKSGNRIPSGIYNKYNHEIDELKFSFYPYIKMRYDTLDTNGNITLDNEIYVLGEYPREICFTDYAEVVYTKDKNYDLNSINYGYSIKLESSQWLSDSASKNMNIFNDEYNVLPGGATLSLSSGQDIRKTVTVNTYQVTLSTAGKAQVENTTGTTLNIPTFESMKESHLEYVHTVMNSLDNMEIVQYYYYNSDKETLKDIAIDWAKGDFSYKPGIQVYPGLDMSKLNVSDGANLKSGILSTDEKYYLRDYKDLSNTSSEYMNNKDRRNDLDVRVALSLSGNELWLDYTRYEIKADTSGNILVNNKIVLTQEQDESKLTGVYKEINDKTLVISKLRDALEYNTGDDTNAGWVTDGDWYNEAFDGVYVYIFTSEIETGLIDNNVRTTIFDPKLNTLSSGTDSSFNTYALNQFRIQDYVDNYGELSKYKIGEFKGSDIHMKEMQNLYLSKPFFNTNVTVQDKH